MMTAIGTVAQPASSQSADGKQAVQITRNRLVCCKRASVSET